MKFTGMDPQIDCKRQSCTRCPHRGVSAKHLQGYISEVCYRFDRGFWEREAFHRLLYAYTSTATITRDDLMETITR